MHGMNIQAEWPHGQRGRKHYRAGCKCGWRAVEPAKHRYIAEIEYKDHRDGPAKAMVGRDLMDRNLKEIRERNQE